MKTKDAIEFFWLLFLLVLASPAIFYLCVLFFLRRFNVSDSKKFLGVDL